MAMIQFIRFEMRLKKYLWNKYVVSNTIFIDFPVIWPQEMHMVIHFRFHGWKNLFYTREPIFKLLPKQNK